jgi:hypothetical protein
VEILSLLIPILSIVYFFVVFGPIIYIVGNHDPMQQIEVYSKPKPLMVLMMAIPTDAELYITVFKIPI